MSVMYTTLSAQGIDSVLVKGFVEDSYRKGIPFASVKFKKDSTSFPSFYTTCDSQGYFEIVLPYRRWIQFIEFTAIGYIDHLSRVLLEPGIVTIEKCQLHESTNDLPEVFIKTNPSISILNDTTSYSVDSFKRGNEANLGELLRELPGFEVQENGTVKYNGKTVNRILLENDDLFGENRYSQIVNNFSPNGIEKIDLVSNFRDKTNMKNTFASGNEQVINIKFKKHRFGKIFGTMSGGTTIKLDRYALKVDQVSLIPKAKFLVTGNANSIGDMASVITDDNSISGDETSVNIGDLPGMNMYAFTRIQDLDSRDIKKSKFSDNHTNLLTANALLKPNNKLSFKENFKIYQDKYTQGQTTKVTYFNIFPEVVIAESANVYKNNNKIQWSSEVNYIPSDKFQMLLKTRFDQLHSTQDYNGLLQQIFRKQHLYRKEYDFSNSIQATYIVGERQLVTTSFSLSNGESPEVLTVSPFLGDSAYNLPSNFDVAAQSVNQSYKIYFGSIKHILNLPNQTITEELNFKYNKSPLTSSVEYYNKPDSIFLGNIYYKNDNEYTQQDYSYAIGITKKDNEKKVGFSSSLRVLYKSLRLSDMLTNKDNEKKNFFLLPSVSVFYFFSSNQRITFSAVRRSVSPSANQLISGGILQDYRNILSGSEYLSNEINTSYSVNYVDFDLAKKKVLLFSMLTYNTGNLPYVSNQITGMSFNVNQSTSFGGSKKTLIFFSSVTKLIKKISSNVTFDISGGNNYGFSLINNVKMPVKSDFFSFEMKMRSFSKGFFNYQFGLKYHLNSQFIDNSIRKNQTLKTYAYLLNGSINFTIKKSWVINLNSDYLYSETGLKQNQNFVITNLSVIYQVKPAKFQISMDIKNISNQKELVTNSLSPYYGSVSAIRLLPRFCLLTLKLQF